MQTFITAAAQVPVSVHSWSESVAITTILWGIIVFLGTGLLWYALGDRSDIKKTLTELVTAVERLNLNLAENYAKKIDVEKLEHKVERHIEHGIQRREMERRAVEDAEG